MDQWELIVFTFRNKMILFGILILICAIIFLIVYRKRSVKRLRLTIPDFEMPVDRIKKIKEKSLPSKDAKRARVGGCVVFRRVHHEGALRMESLPLSLVSLSLSLTSLSLSLSSLVSLAKYYFHIFCITAAK